MMVDELEDLRQRLAEAEETIRAIRTGEVDALVVSNSDDVSVFDIGGDTESYRAFMEVMDVGAAAIDDRGRLLYANGNLVRVFGRSASQLQGAVLAELFDAESGKALQELMLAQGEPHGVTQVTVSGSQFMLALRPLRLGTVRGYAVTLTDVTERVRSELAIQSERAARAVIASANEAVIVCDRDGVITHANTAAGNLYSGDLLGQVFADVIPLNFANATGLLQADDIVAMAIGGTPVQGMEAVAPNAPGSKDYLVSAAPLQVGNDAISGCVVTLIDLSHRKAAEKQQLLLMRELDHRVKNTLALVLSIAGRTLHHEDTLEGFQRSFTGRIQALSATHNLLAENSWTDLQIAEIVRAELAPYTGDIVGRVAIDGLDIGLQPRAAIALGLVIHELATNAAKYGALSVPEGHVAVRFVESTEVHGAPVLVIEWRESGGPPVAPPTRKGFGQSVVARSLQYSPGGGSELTYAPEGVVCLIRIPASDIT